MTKSSPLKTSRLAPVAALVILAALPFAVYLPSVGGEFLWDDGKMLWKSPLTLADDGIVRCWTGGEGPDYWPLTSSALWVQYRLWGRDARGYRIVNIALHAISGLLLWGVLTELGISGGWLAAALFAVHPVCAASVAWIAELKNTLSMPFFLVAIWAYLRFDGRRWPWYAAALVAFAAAMLSKTSTVIAPVVLLGLVAWRRGRVTRKDLLHLTPLFALAAVMAFVTIRFQHAHAMVHFDRPASGVARILLAAKAAWFYLYKALWPLKLSMIYPRWDPNAADALSIAALVGWLAVAAVAIIRIRTWGRPLAMGLGCYIVALAPALGFVDMSFMRFSFVSDHFQYLALPCVIALVVSAGWYFAMKLPHRYRVFPAVAAVAAAGLLGWSTWQRGSVFAGPESLWTDTLKKNPAAWVAEFSLANVLSKEHADAEAIEHYSRAIEMNDQYAEALDGRGIVYARQGKIAEAIADYRRASQIADARPESHYLAAIAWMRTDPPNLVEAEKELDMAIELDPKCADAWFHLGRLRTAQNRPREAIAAYRRTLALRPGWSKAANNLAWILATDADPAARDGRQAVGFAELACGQTGYRDIQMLLCLAAAYAEAARPADAAAAAMKAHARAKAVGDKRTRAIEQLASRYAEGKTYDDWKHEQQKTAQTKKVQGH